MMAKMKRSGDRKTRRKPSAAAKPSKLRVIGGQLRGRTIQYHGAAFTRPMKDNIRENLFNILGSATRGAVCIDLFAGTGALAFESLSRGAKEAVVVEQHRDAVRYIRQTAESLDVASRIRLITGDAFRLAPQLLAPPEDDTPWVVFLCPPYALWEEALDRLVGIIEMVLNNAPPGSVLVAETEKKFPADRLPSGDWDLREYGGTRLAFIEPAIRCGLSL
jgi:16S rRNA (guanine966-N2)-methyltransferase